MGARALGFVFSNRGNGLTLPNMTSGGGGGGGDSLYLLFPGREEMGSHSPISLSLSPLGRKDTEARFTLLSSPLEKGEEGSKPYVEFSRKDWAVSYTTIILFLWT